MIFKIFNNKKKFLKLVLLLECGVVLYLWIYGVYGIKSLYHLSCSYQEAVFKKATIEKKIDQLRALIEESNEDDFFIEKLAREKLQMAYSDDVVYFLCKDERS